MFATGSSWGDIGQVNTYMLASRQFVGEIKVKLLFVVVRGASCEKYGSS